MYTHTHVRLYSGKRSIQLAIVSINNMTVLDKMFIGNPKKRTVSTRHYETNRMQNAYGRIQ